MDLDFLKTNPCSPYSIAMRREEAKYNVDVIEHKRKQREMERTFRHNSRKLKVTQVGVMSLLGRDPYPDCHPDNILFSHNQPGFCYRRNGTPRRFSSLAESETRKILDDLEGNLGYLEEPASNIVSDNPVLTEVLSSPQIVSVLCNLRSTAAIMKDAFLFKQFVRNIQKNSPHPLRFKEETPYDFLRQYRTDLINQFFEAFQVQAEIRLSMANETGNSMNADAVESTGSKSNPLSAKGQHDEFAKVLTERLMEAQTDPFTPKYVPNDSSPIPTDSPDPIIKQQLLQLGLRKVESFKGLSPSVYGFHDTSPPSRKPSKVTIALLPPQNTAEDTPKTPRPLKTIPGTPKDDQGKHSRNEFANFVKSLIMEVEQVNAASKSLQGLHGQKVSRKLESLSPLIKLLRKKSLFSSLTDDDLLFYEYKGGKKGAEKNIAKELNISTYPAFTTTNGLAFHVPTRVDSVATTSVEYNRPWSPLSGLERERGFTATSFDTTCDTMLSEVENTHSCSPGYRSLARVCCGACKAKIWQVCDAIRARDIKDKATMPRWRSAGTGWSNKYSTFDKIHGIKGVPVPTRKNYLYDSADTTRTINSRPTSSSRNLSSQGSQFNSGDIPGAPTPVWTRNKFFPSRSQNSPKKSGLGGKGSEHFGSNMSDSFSIGTNGVPRKSTRGRMSWTLKISRLEIMKLRHELDVEQIKGELESFEKKVLTSKLGSQLTN